MVKFNNIIKAIEDELIKTHDGTSSGPIRTVINQHMKEFLKSQFRTTTIYSENGEKLAESYTTTDEEHNEDYDEEGEELNFGSGWTFNNLFTENANMVIKPSYDPENNPENNHISDEYITFTDKNGRQYILPTIEEYGQLTEMSVGHNGFTFQSISILGPDGTSTTLVHNNKFNENDRETYTNMMKEMYKDIKDKINDGYDGDLKDYINSEWNPRFEKECNVKIKQQYHNIRDELDFDTSNPYDSEDYGNEWYDKNEAEPYFDPDWTISPDFRWGV